MLTMTPLNLLGESADAPAPSEAISLLQSFRNFITSPVNGQDPARWPVLIDESTDYYGSGISEPTSGQDNGYFYVSRPYFNALKAASDLGGKEFGVIIGLPLSVGTPTEGDFKLWMGRANELAMTTDGLITNIQAANPETTTTTTPTTSTTKSKKWLWIAGGAAVLLGGGAAVAFALRGRGKMQPAVAGRDDWDDDWDDWDPDDEWKSESQSPYEEQVERIQELHPQAPKCRREYDMADALMKSHSRNAKVYCEDVRSLSQGIEAAWEGKCKVARNYIRRAHCGRSPV